MDPADLHIHSFIVKVWQEAVVADASEYGWRGYVTHVPSGARRYFDDLDEILAFVEPTLILDAAMRTLGATDPASAIADETERAALDPFGSSPEPAEVEMDSSPSGLQLLQKQLGDGDRNVNKAENDASGAQSAAADAQLKLKRARDAQAALQKTVDEATASTAAIDKAIAGSIGPSATAAQVRKDVETALGKALSDDQRKAVDQVQKRSADQRAALAKAQEQKAKDALDAQERADAAISKNVAAAASFATAQSAFKDRAATIQALTARVTTLCTAATAALNGKRPGAAYRLNEQLSQALQDLGAEVGKGSADLQDGLSDAWSKASAASDDQSATADKLVIAKADLKAADDALKAFDAKGEASLTEQIASLEKQWAAATDGGGGSTTKPAAQSSTPPKATEPDGGIDDGPRGADADQGYGEATA